MKTFSGPHHLVPLTMADLKFGSAGEWRSWKSTAGACLALRNQVQMWARTNQAGRCAYCLFEVNEDVSRSETIDHFVPQSLVRRWTYEPWNLVLACYTCNSKRKKAFNPLILRVGEDVDTVVYRNCVFRIVHPYLDVASDHLQGGYQADGVEPTPIRAVSTQGEKTIRVFGLDTPGRFLEWLKDYLATKHLAELAKIPGALDQFDRLRAEMSGRI